MRRAEAVDLPKSGFRIRKILKSKIVGQGSQVDFGRDARVFQQSLRLRSKDQGLSLIHICSIFSSGYSCYGAHLDDSVVSQVYNNIPEQPGAVEAVESTAGMVLFYGDQAADTRFFSTSCGFTANYHEVWSDPETGSFPAEPVPYLKAVSQVLGESFELEREEELARFLQHGDWPAYDRDSPYFRWQVKMRCV